MAKSPLMELREMNVSKQREAKADSDVPPISETEPHTSADTHLLTQVSNDLSKQVSKSLTEDLGGGRGEDASITAADMPAGTRRPGTPRRGPRTGGGNSPTAGYAGVKDRLQLGTGKEPLVRLSVDVTESLHTRLKQYCAANRIPSGRMLIVTLLEDFLNSEGA